MLSSSPLSSLTTLFIRSCKDNPKHKQRQGFHTDAAAAAAEQQQPVAAAAAAARGWLDGGASIGARLWQGLH